MKFTLILCVLIGAACAQYDYQPQIQEEPEIAISHPQQEYIPPPAPVAAIEPEGSFDEIVDAAPAAELASDGYRYRTVKKFKYRHRV